MKKYHLVTIIILFAVVIISANNVKSQAITYLPDHPTTEDTITIIYDASKGNGTLMNYAGSVYIHTGLLTVHTQSTGADTSDWTNVVGNWGTADPKVLMESLGNHLYRKTIPIKEFYSIQPDQEVLQIGFLFRNTNGTIVGKLGDESNIFVPLNQEIVSGYVSHTFNNNKLNITTENANIIIEPYTSEIINVAVYPDNIINSDSSYVVVLSPQNPVTFLNDEEEYLKLSTQMVDIVITKYPIRIYYLQGNDTVLADHEGFYWQYENKGISFRLKDNESIYGTGSRGLPINRRGYSFQSYNVSTYDYIGPVKEKNITIPFFSSSGHYGIYFDNQTPGYFDIGNFNISVLDYYVEFGSFSYFAIFGNNSADILESYTQLTGRQPLPPRWSMGYIQSRFGYRDEVEARQIVNDMRDEGFPMDGLVLDLYWFGGISAMGNLDWDYTMWPTPVDMINDFNELGVNLITISEPFVVETSDNFDFLDNNKYLCTDSAGSTYIMEDFWTGPAALLDITKMEVGEWMWDYYYDRIQEGVKGFWCDLGEPQDQPSDMYHSIGNSRFVHNIYSLIWEEMLYKNYKEILPDERVFILPRSGYAGMQRYSTFPWSGDVNRSFAGFEVQIPLILGMSMSGIGYMHCDMGGFAGGYFHPELYTRWLEFGAFAPVMRAHSQEAVPPEPIYYPEPYKSIVRDYIKLRYRMLPYNYTLAWRNNVFGTPLMLPLNFYYDNPELLNINHEYLWGENILVAPVMEGGINFHDVTLPDGKWIYYWNNHSYEGYGEVSVEAPLEWLPLFIKAGSFIPMVEEMLTTKDYSTDSLIIKYYPDYSVPVSSYTLYDDDGKTPDHFTLSNCELLNFEGNIMDNDIRLVLTKSGDGFQGSPETRKINFEIQRIGKQPEKVTHGGTEVPVVQTLEEYLSLPKAALWIMEKNLLYVHFNWVQTEEIILIEDIEISEDIDENITVKKDNFYLYPLYPNPFIEQTTIMMEFSESGDYYLSVSNTYGRVVMDRHLVIDQPGNKVIIWKGNNSHGDLLPDGIYFVSLTNGKELQTHKALLLR